MSDRYSPRDKKLMKAVGDAVRRQRTRQRLSRKELAERSGISIQTVMQLENGDRVLIAYLHLRQIAEALGTSPERLELEALREMADKAPEDDAETLYELASA